MAWDGYGFLVPEISGSCGLCGECLKVCPFNPFPGEAVETENELAGLFLEGSNFHHSNIGRYNGIYAGYSNEFRPTSSSGGIATFVLTKILENGIVDHILSVRESSKDGSHYEYAISSSRKDLLASSGTKYFPVTLAPALSMIHEMEGRTAIAGVACFIRAIRLAQHYDPSLKEKIPFLVGIICGGIKSRSFTEFLVSKAGVNLSAYRSPQFRIKDFSSTAADYSFGCFDALSNKRVTLKMNSVGDMWGTGLFKANACDFCDDVTTELADISLGDAWMKPYDLDGRGTNVIVTRSPAAGKIIRDGIKAGELTVEKVLPDRFLASQQGSINHRHTGLSARIAVAGKRGLITPPKRFGNEKTSADFCIVQKIRMRIRRKSLEIWKETHDVRIFHSKLRWQLTALKIATIIYHYRKGISKRIRNLVPGKL
jgi:coenzyme F420 hydrogenase subunit beta